MDTHNDTIYKYPIRSVRYNLTCRLSYSGTKGNAASTPAHVHYGIVTPIPYVWKAFDSAGTCNPPKRFNWRLMFWLDPSDHLPVK